MIRANSTAVVGLQWGDEGKGKAVDRLAAEHDAVVRFNGGANAGHSVVVNGNRFALHLVPSGILHQGKLAVVGNGVVVDPEKLLQEIEGLETRGVKTAGLIVSDRAHVVAPYHKAEDALREDLLQASIGSGGSGGEIGTTKRGIGPAYAEKIQRSTAVRMGDLLRPDVLREKVSRACMFKNSMLSGMAERAGNKEFAPFDPERVSRDLMEQGQQLRARIQDTTYLLHDLLAKGKRILFEGANATLLDVDHGTYPFVTSSSTTVHGIGPGTGVSERCLSTVLGVMKAYSTRVGRGPMPTELLDDVGGRIRERGREYGTTTGRPRRVGWLDLVAVKYAAMVNGITGIVLTLLDVLDGFDELKICTQYNVRGQVTDRFMPDGHDLAVAEPVFTTFKGFHADLSNVRKLDDLPAAARRYLDFIQNYTGVPLVLVGVGPGREQTIEC
jgi:adenylosuccinate synthase